MCRWPSRAGAVQAMFPEGALSRDGLMRAPEGSGCWITCLRGFDPRGERDIAFVPVGINYDRVPRGPGPCSVR